ncbi:MAG: hypothetical protein ACOCXA_00150 [Planctomycetota bacterium]
MISLDTAAVTTPLSTVTASAPGAAVLLLQDGAGRIYARATGERLRATIAGALGHHLLIAQDGQGRELDRRAFRVDCQSGIQDAEGRYARLLNRLMLRINQDLFGNAGKVNGIDGGMQRGFVITSRDHVHGHKALRYYYNWNREWLDAFAEHQREDGMVWDFFVQRPRQGIHFELRWGEDFYRVVEDESIFARQPVMNDLEHMFIRGIWQSWRSTGDDAWMTSRLDNALRALRYATTSPYTWSERFQLVHRPCCIDMWDFQSEFDSAVVGGDHMQAIPGVSKYGIMHGDSMGLARACDELAEMLRHAGRKTEADEVAGIGRGMRERLDAIAWNGHFFTHFVPEDPDFERPFGVDTDTQVSLSNAYALNRGIPHEQAVAIIETYRRIRQETADFGPGEWYCMYPPFPRGFGSHGMWHYVNGGVSPMVAGELAHGACEHGYEQYAVDIIDRVAALAEQHGQIPRVWRGRIEEEPQRTCTPLDLRAVANTAFHGEQAGQAIPWTQEGDNDMRNIPTGSQRFQEVPCEIIDLAGNPSGACVGISLRPPYTPSASIPVGRQAASLYLVHALHGGGAGIAGILTLRYADGSEHRQYVQRGRHISGWWQPKDQDGKEASDPRMLVAWSGDNARSKDVGMVIWGLDNPHPDKVIQEMVCEASQDGAVWLLAAVTISDQPVWFRPNGRSGGIPAPWSLGAVVWALFEGLGGVYDEAPNFGAVRLAPRWSAGDTGAVTVHAKYEEGGGYASYRYERQADRLRLLASSSASARRYELLVPPAQQPRQLLVDGTETAFTTRQIEDSLYVCWQCEHVAAQDIELLLET